MKNLMPNFWLAALLAAVTLIQLGCQTTTNQPFRLDSMGASNSSSDDLAKMGTSSSGRLLPDFFSPQKNKAKQFPKHPLIAQQDRSSLDRMKATAGSWFQGKGSGSEIQQAAANDPISLQSRPEAIRPGLHLSAARMMQQQGDAKGAIQHYEKLLASRPGDRNGLIGLARAKHQLGDLEGAITTYQSALRKLGPDPVVLNDMGLCLARAERYQQAVTALRAALQQSPENLMYRNNLAAVLVQADNAAQAVDVLAESHGPAVANYNVAYLLNKRGDTSAAVGRFQRALHHDPQFEPARQMLDRLQPQIGQRPQEAPSRAVGDNWVGRMQSATTTEVVLNRPPSAPTAQVPLANLPAQTLPVVGGKESFVIPAAAQQEVAERAPSRTRRDLPRDIRQLSSVRLPDAVRPEPMDSPGMVAPMPPRR